MDVNEEEIEYHVMNACIMGQLEVILKYIDSHNVNNFLYNGWTPLLYAASNVQAEVIEYLIKNGADVNKHKDGYTPLMALCFSTKNTTEQRIKCLMLLIQAGANVNASSKQRQTPLMYACISQEPEFITELIKYVKNINLCDNRKQTSLMYATIANKPEVVKILMEKAADITLTDYNNLTVNDIASMKGYDKILSLLNCNEEEIINTCEIAKVCDWKDMFPVLSNINDQTLDSDVYTILYGMNLENYSHIFQGMDLKTFLKLTENDLRDLGIDIKAHRMQFMEHLHRFHRKKWNIQSIGDIKKSLPYTLYDAIVSLGTVAKQTAIINSSFYYIKNNLIEVNNKESIHLTEEQISNYKHEIKKTQKTLNVLKEELLQMEVLSKVIQKENDIGVPATYIDSKKHWINWSMFLGITLIIGICVSKTICIQKLIQH
ncbi:Ankyrin repeat, SAM and basic leucine zipper domain-containing protein 1 [Anthophora retusa]